MNTVRLVGVRAEVAVGLRARLLEIEEAALARSYEVSDPSETEDVEYLAGLRASISAAIEFGIAGLEEGEDRVGPVPEVLLTQARQAARSGVDLDVVMRRCFAGYTLLGDFLLLAVELGELTLTPGDMRHFWGAQATLLDRLVSEMAEVYKREAADRLNNLDSRRLARVRKLLAGQLLNPRELGGYELDAWHIGAVAVGPGAFAVMQDMAATLDCRVLLVSPLGETAWAWFGGRKKVSGNEILQLASGKCPADVSFSLGEPARGISGWRCTHRQAKAAIPIALNQLSAVVRYRDVALLASALRDDLLMAWLATTYLDPLTQEGDEGVKLRLTLQAYFAAGRNASSAAAALRVSRQTVNSRLRIIEGKVGRSIDACSAEFETALRLRDLWRAGDLT
jgi:hypothetical protein